MLLEEVLAGHRAGRGVRRRCWSEEFTAGMYGIGLNDLFADDWELSPEAPVVIDLVKYADGYEFEFGERNWILGVDIAGKYVRVSSKNWKDLGSVYMDEEKVFALINKLNSGEWVLK